MAAGGKTPQPESFTESLNDVYMAIANAKLAPDADLQFCNQLEMVVMGRLKQPAPKPGGAQPPGAAGGGAPGGPPGAPPGGPAPSPGGQVPPGNQTPPQGGPAPHPSIPPMDPDEMRRTIAESTGS